MKRVFVLIFLALILLGVAYGIDKKKTTDPVGFSAMVPDTTKLCAYQTADSVQIVVVFYGAVNSGLCLNAWYHAGDAEADSSQGILAWWDEIADIDADSGAGLYMVSGRFYDASLGLDYYRDLVFYLGGSADSLAIDALLDSMNAGLVDVGDLDSIVAAKLADSASYTVNANLVASVDIDSVLALLLSYGWKLGIIDGSHSDYNINADRDTNWIFNPAHTDSMALIRIHTGGAAAGRPDSTRTEQ